MSQAIAIIAGVGPGTGASIAHRFSSHYPVVLLSRNPDNYNPTVEEIKKNGGTALGVSTDLTSSASVSAMIETVKKEYGHDVTASAAIFNANGAFVRKPFLEITEKEWDAGYTGSAKAAFNFSQAVLPLLSSSSPSSSQSPSATATATAGPPTLIFTGATASVKASANFSLFASTKYAIRALSQSLAKEYGPQGVHVAHAVIDGVIDIPRTKAWDLGEGAKIEPGAIADAYWWLHGQPRTSWTWEVDLRPGVEKW